MAWDTTKAGSDIIASSEWNIMTTLINATSGTALAASGVLLTVSGAGVTTNTNLIGVSGTVVSLSGAQYTLTTNFTGLSGTTNSLSGNIVTISGVNATQNTNITTASGVATYASGTVVWASGLLNSGILKIGSPATATSVTGSFIGVYTGLWSGSNIIDITTSGALYTQIGRIDGVSGALVTVSGAGVTATGIATYASGTAQYVSGLALATSGALYTQTGRIDGVSGALITVSGAGVTTLGIANYASGTAQWTSGGFVGLSGTVTSVDGRATYGSGTALWASGLLNSGVLIVGSPSTIKSATGSFWGLGSFAGAHTGQFIGSGILTGSLLSGTLGSPTLIQSATGSFWGIGSFVGQHGGSGILIGSVYGIVGSPAVITGSGTLIGGFTGNLTGSLTGVHTGAFTGSGVLTGSILSGTIGSPATAASITGSFIGIHTGLWAGSSISAGAASPDTSIQFADSTTLAGASGLTYNKTTKATTATQITGSFTGVYTGLWAGSTVVAGAATPDTSFQYANSTTLEGASLMTYNRTTGVTSIASLLLTNATDGFAIQGGTGTARTLYISGADITLLGSGTSTYTFPGTDGSIIIDVSAQTLTSKTLGSPTLVVLATGSFTGIHDGLWAGSAIAAGGANPTTSFQFNDGGTMAGASAFTYVKTTNVGTYAGSLNVSNFSASGTMVGSQYGVIGSPAILNASGTFLGTCSSPCAAPSITGSFWGVQSGTTWGLIGSPTNAACIVGSLVGFSSGANFGTFTGAVGSPSTCASLTGSLWGIQSGTTFGLIGSPTNAGWLTGSFAGTMANPRIYQRVYFDSEYNNGSLIGSPVVINWASGNKQLVLVSGGLTFNFTNGSVGNYVLRLKNGGAFTADYNTTLIKWQGGTKFVNSQTLNVLDIVSFYCDGTNYYGQGASSFS